MNRPLTTRLSLMYLIALIPLIIFGFYKNGISLYSKEYANFLGMFKPLLLILMSVTGNLLANLLKGLKSKKQIDFSNVKFGLVESIILAMCLPISSSPLIVFVVSLICSLFFRKSKLNQIAVMYLLIQGFNYLLKLGNFENAYEASTLLNHNGLDLFLGFGVGGVASTSIILTLLALIFMSFNKLYKKDLVYTAILTFVLLGAITNIIDSNYTEIFSYIFSGNVIFMLVFVLPNLNSTSYTSKGQVLSGILVGILTYLLSFITPFNAVVISILLISPLKGIFDRIFIIK